MPIGIAGILFMVGLVGAYFSFQAANKGKKEKRKANVAVAFCIAFCLMMVLSVGYMLLALLLFKNIN